MSSVTALVCQSSAGQLYISSHSGIQAEGGSLRHVLAANFKSPREQASLHIYLHLKFLLICDTSHIFLHSKPVM